MNHMNPSALASLATTTASTGPVEASLHRIFTAVFFGVTAWAMAEGVLPASVSTEVGGFIGAFVAGYVWRAQRTK